MTSRRSSSQTIKRVLITALGLLVIGVGIHALTTTNNTAKPSQSKHAASNSNLVKIVPSGINYPSSWQEAQSIPLDSEQAGVISQASRTNPTVNVSIRAVKGALTKDFNIQNLPSEAVASLESGVSGFKLRQQSLTKIGTYQAVRIDYTTPGSGQAISTDAMFIIPTLQKTFYITYQSSGEGLSEVGADISQINLSVSQL